MRSGKRWHSEHGLQKRWCKMLMLRRPNITAPYFSSLDSTCFLAVCISAGVYATTQQAQGFKDIHGDRVVGRCTLPIIDSSIARYKMIVPMIAWSVVSVWKLHLVSSSLFRLLSMFVGVRYPTHTTVKDDQISFWWYNVSVSANVAVISKNQKRTGSRRP